MNTVNHSRSAGRSRTAASGWTRETEQSYSPWTARLIKWMTRCPGDALISAEAATSWIERGLLELTEAESVTVVLCENRGGGENAESDSPEQQLWDTLPIQPFFFDEAPRGLQDIINSVAWLQPKLEDAIPLFLPMPILDEPSSLPTENANMAGLALLWFETENGYLETSWRSLLEAVAIQAGAWLQAARRFAQLSETVGEAMDGRDGREGYSRDAAFYAVLIARELGMEAEEVERIRLAALLAGLGKAIVPDEVLRKNSALDADEVAQIRQANITGAAWLEHIDGNNEVTSMVRHQAERYDGKGTPDNLKGEQISIGSRIIAVAQRFAAMTRPRADRPALSVVGGALEFLAYESGTALDPQIVRAFLAVMGRQDVSENHEAVGKDKE